MILNSYQRCRFGVLLTSIEIQYTILNIQGLAGRLNQFESACRHGCF
ncbi:hypothetical protein SAMN02745225_01580 [Ferrithrix thermotolerans DSM 19514]|uniref:Uncharacterized protein n=1 Tax=Ferrithrix thermotolerans DSM 19514 TaxID=1121881 RepID=A0A1M4W8F0_9ACTN|nr:hypothetical protein SAMN02745225_01580 [Ferrithrix thermotolerans DSM 19514]